MFYLECGDVPLGRVSYLYLELTVFNRGKVHSNSFLELSAVLAVQSFAQILIHNAILFGRPYLMIIASNKKNKILSNFTFGRSSNF